MTDHMGLAVDLDKGDGTRTLVVPVLRDADTFDFAGFLAAVSNTMMDSAKASMVKSACKKNWFSSAQLGQLLDVFMMEANKFEAAQAAVPRLVDPQNAYGLAEKFMFNANKTAFTALLSE